MKKTLRFVLAALMACVGMNSWAQADYSTYYGDRSETLSRTDRYAKSFTLQTTDGKTNVTHTWGKAAARNYVYVDDSETCKIEIAASATFTVSIDAAMNAMHSYLYLDKDGDGFSAEVDETTHRPTESSDLIAFSKYKNYNSDGNAVSDQPWKNPTPSPVAAPAVPGEYRCRIKIDWNNIDPKGIAAGQNNATISNGGAIIDFTLKVVSPQQAEYNALLAQARTDIDFAKSTESRNVLGEWLVTAASQIYSPKTETREGSIGALIDDNTNTYWHSSWAAVVDFGSEAQMQHYLQFDLGKPCQALNMKYANRKDVVNDAPSAFSVTASTTIDGEYTEVTTITGVGKQDGTIFNYTFDMGAEYQYIRVRSTSSHGSLQRGYWHCSEMNFCEYTVEEGAKLYTKAGSIATDIEAILANPSAAPTQEDVDALQALCDQLHALIHDIDQYRGYPSKLNMYGGYKATEEQAAALADAIENYDADAAAAVVATMTAVDNARTAFTLVCERGNLFAAEKDGATLLVSSNNRWEGVTCANEDDAKWAFVTFNGGTYLYNVGKKLFFNADRTLTDTPDANAIAVEELNLNAAYPFVLKSGSSYFNTQVANNTTGGQDYDAGVVVNGWGGAGKWDTGNQYKIMVADDFDPAVAVEVIINAAAQADMDRLEALQADLTQFILGKEEYISADVRQAIETIMGETYRMAIYGAAQDAMENSTAYVSPDFWTTLETQIVWIKAQIEKVVNGEEPILEDSTVSVGFDADLDEQGATNLGGGKNASKVVVYSNRVVIENFLDVAGCNLVCNYWYDDDLEDYAVTKVAIEGEDEANPEVDTLDDENFGMGSGSTITIGEQTLTYMGGKVDPSLNGHITLAFAEGYVKYVWGEYNATGINGINAVSGKAVYNLNGQRVNAAKSGLYIVGGQKVVVK